MTRQPILYTGVLPQVAWYLGFHIRENTATVDIIIRMYDKNNNLVGTYFGIAADKSSTSMYKNTILGTPTITNKTFSMAVKQIREQILRDGENLESK